MSLDEERADLRKHGRLRCPARLTRETAQHDRMH
jgi:hypothetical protein